MIPNLAGRQVSQGMSRRSSARKLALLAPPSSSASFSSKHHARSSPPATSLLAEVQTLRGSVYVRDGALGEHELVQGRHEADSDWHSWHLMIQDGDDQILGCARYTAHANTAKFSDLGVSRSALAHHPDWGSKLEASVASALAMARKHNRHFVEFGGWALDESIRGTAEAVRMLLAMYGLAQTLGGGVGVTTATVRHCSASILKKIGGRPLEHDGVELPRYFDSQYDCDMEILKFHSWDPNPRYLPWIEEMKSELRDVSVLHLDGRRAAAVQ